MVNLAFVQWSWSAFAFFFTSIVNLSERNLFFFQTLILTLLYCDIVGRRSGN